MPDAWTILKNNSSLASGDAWEHLNNQMGGTGTIIVDGAIVELTNNNFETEINNEDFSIEVAETFEANVEINNEEFTVGITDGFEIKIENNEYIVEVCDG